MHDMHYKKVLNRFLVRCVYQCLNGTKTNFIDVFFKNWFILSLPKGCMLSRIVVG